MGLIDKFKKAIRADDSDYDSSPDEMYNYGGDEDDDVIINGGMSNNNSIYSNHMNNNMQYQEPNNFQNNMNNMNSMNNGNNGNNSNNGSNGGFIPNTGNNIQNNNQSIGLTMANQASVEMKLASPREFEEVGLIANHLLQKKTIVMNLENANKETRKRLMDFLSGVAYAIDGQVKRVSVDTIIIAPSDVDISGDTPRPTNRGNNNIQNDRLRGNNNYDDDMY